MIIWTVQNWNHQWFAIYVSIYNFEADSPARCMQGCKFCHSAGLNADIVHIRYEHFVYVSMQGLQINLL